MCGGFKREPLSQGDRRGGREKEQTELNLSTRKSRALATASRQAMAGSGGEGGAETGQEVFLMSS